MGRLIVAVIDGTLLGGTFALMAIGLSLINRATRVFNMAHGEFMLLPAFIVGRWASISFGLATAIALLAVAAVAAIFYRLALRRMVGLPLWMPLVATLGLASVLDGAMGVVFGSNTYLISLPGLPRGTVNVFGARAQSSTLALAAVSYVIVLAVAAALRWTDVGTRLRATGQDVRLAGLGGIVVDRIFLGSWMLGAVLAGLAGIIYGGTNVVSSGIAQLALLAFPGLVLGGLDSVAGAIVGSLVIGVMQGIVTMFIGTEDISAITYALLLVTLLVLPNGMFGTRNVQRV